MVFPVFNEGKHLSTLEVENLTRNKESLLVSSEKDELINTAISNIPLILPGKVNGDAQGYPSFKVQAQEVYNNLYIQQSNGNSGSLHYSSKNSKGHKSQN